MTANFTSLQLICLEKIERLRSKGIEPYPPQASRTHTNVEDIQAFESAETAGQTDPISATPLVV